MGKNRRLLVLKTKPYPSYVVWELTLRCDQRCLHCGSRAAIKRKDELNLAEALNIVADLKRLHAKEVILIGGEAYLHRNFSKIVEALIAAHIEVGMTTGGKGVTLELATKIKELGIERVSVSIDGLKNSHNLLRGSKSSFLHAMLALKNLKEAGIRLAVNTTINNINKNDLEELYSILKEQKIVAWQVQIIAALGRASDNDELLLEPYDLLTIVPTLARLKQRAFRDGILIMPGNNLGYFGEDEALLRSITPDGCDHFSGCQAGRFILGIESDGTIKGCPSLPTDHYKAGNIKEKSLFDIWHNSPEFQRLRLESPKELWGFCKTCDFKEPCQGGCTFTAHGLFGKAGNNPFCYYRAKKLAQKGIKEVLIKQTSAPGHPFDHALFNIEEKAITS